MTRALLACGILAGPTYITVYLGQAFTRPGSTSRATRLAF